MDNLLPDFSFQAGEYLVEYKPNDPLDEFHERVACEELREDPSTRQQSIQKLKQIIRKRGELQMNFEHDKIYLTFLRCCKFYEEEAYKKMLIHYKFMKKQQKFYENMSVKNDASLIKSNFYNYFPLRDKLGRQLNYINLGKWDLQEYSLLDLLRCTILVFMSAMFEENTTVSGIVVIIDVSGITFNHVLQFSPFIAKSYSSYIQKCAPCRVKCIHIINNYRLFNLIFNMFKPFIKEKIRNRIFLHGSDYTKMVEMIGADSLPSSLGGNMNFEPVYGDFIYQMMEGYSKFIELFLSNKYTGK